MNAFGDAGDSGSGGRICLYDKFDVLDFIGILGQFELVVDR